MISVLEFCNRVRSVLNLPMLPRVGLVGTEQDDEKNCVVGRALGIPVGASEHPDWCGHGGWVMRLPDGATARLVGVATGLAWRADLAEVALPEEIVDLAVSHHLAAAEGDEFGALVAWSVLDQVNGQWERFTPTQPIIVDSREIFPRAA